MLNESALLKKRQFAEERAARLRDPRARCVGIDKEALAHQVQEKEAMKKLEGDRNQYFDQQRVLMDKHAQVLQREVAGVRADRERDTQSFRESFQKKQMSREWDLNDPARLKQGLPARVNDTDPRTGPSGLQKFEGEDLDAGERRRLQAAQQKEWTQQQTDEKLMKKWMEADATRQYEDRAEEVAYRTHQVQTAVANQRHEAAVTTAEFNKALAEQKRQEKLKSRFDNTQKNLEEVDNMMRSDFLGETGASTMGGAKDKVNSTFKGMTGNQRHTILAEQEAQREDLRQRRLLEAEDGKQQDMQEKMHTRMAMTLDRQRDRERKQAAQQLGRDRQQQAADARDKKKSLDEVYTNAIGEEYFVYGKCL
jgi:hypothetical protein